MTVLFESDPYAEFLRALPQVANETTLRELFVILAVKAFADREFAQTLALGAEYAVAFSHRGLIRRGRVDSFVENVLVEFKAKLANDAARNSARDQLAGYVAGAWAEDGGYQRPYLGVATDGTAWHVYSALPVDIRIPATTADPSNVRMSLVETWPPQAGTLEPDSLRRFLNRTFFRKTLLQPTSDNFARDFGLDSPAFLSIRDALSRKATQLSSSPQMRLYETSWKADLQVAYGHVDETGDLFVRHTYLALLARLLVWATLERRPAEPEDLRQVFDRTYFIAKRVGNLVEDDYFAWHRLPSEIDLTPVWTSLVAQLATYRLDAVAEDVLKPLYEMLVDPEMRHDLGEYYTPDWLANSVVDHLVDGWQPSVRGLPRMLDPACGSGSFLRAAIHKLRASQEPDLSAADSLKQVLSHVHGMDVHPLAVIVAKATYLLAIADLIPAAPDPVNLPVYLCNSLSGERLDRTMSLLGDLVELEIGQGGDARKYPVPDEFVTDGAAYDRAITEVVDMARSIGSSRTASHHADAAIRYRLASLVASFPQADVLLNSMASMGVYMSELVKRGEDSIYGFLLRNRYRSILLRSHFDLIVGNPPWLTLADISAGSYRDLLLLRNDELQIAPRSAREQAHTEIATVFLAQTLMQFTRPREDAADVARLGFVLPRSVFSATHHRLFREGKYKPRIDIVEIWDLDPVSPLFNVPSCVLFANTRIPRPHRNKPGRIYSGRLPSRDPEVGDAKRYLTVRHVEFTLRSLGRRSAWGLASNVEETEDERLASTATRLADHVAAQKSAAQPYASRFRQGAVLYPQTLLIVDQIGNTDPITSGSVTVRTSETAASSAKLLKELRLQRVVNAETLFLTAAADHIVPYRLRQPLWTVVLPVITGPQHKGFAALDPDAMRGSGLVLTADWFDEAEEHWESVRKTSEHTPLWERLNHLGHLHGQEEQRRYILLFAASGSRITAAVLDTAALSRPFVARDKTYWMSTDDVREAYYVAAFLNSAYVDELVSDFVTRGLWGKRDIHKRVLDVPWQSWNPADSRHVQLAELGAQVAAEVDELIHGLSVKLGSARSELRQALNVDRLMAIEKLVRSISG